MQKVKAEWMGVPGAEATCVQIFFFLCFKETRTLVEGRWRSISKEQPERHADGLSGAHEAFSGSPAWYKET